MNEIDERIAAITDEFLQQCGPCDYGLPMGCSCSNRDFRGSMVWLIDQLQKAREGCEQARSIAVRLEQEVAANVVPF